VNQIEWLRESPSRSTVGFGSECRRCFREVTLMKAGEDKSRDCGPELPKEPFSRPGTTRELSACANRDSAGFTLTSEPLGSVVIPGRLVAGNGGVNANEP
jgi:hypothetical protein